MRGRIYTYSHAHRDAPNTLINPTLWAFGMCWFCNLSSTLNLSRLLVWRCRTVCGIVGQSRSILWAEYHVFTQQHIPKPNPTIHRLRYWIPSLHPRPSDELESVTLMKDWKVLAIATTALAGAVLMGYLAWRIANGESEVMCVSNAYSFGCFTNEGDLFGVVAALEIAAGAYLWRKFREYFVRVKADVERTRP
jgi:hypothetical protein